MGDKCLSAFTVNYSKTYKNGISKYVILGQKIDMLIRKHVLDIRKRSLSDANSIYRGRKIHDL